MMAFLLMVAQAGGPSAVEVSLDRTLATIVATFVLFLIGQLVVAIKWGSRISTIVDLMVRRLDTLTNEVGDIKKSLYTITEQKVRIEEHATRLHDHDSRLRSLEISVRNPPERDPWDS